MCVCVCLSKGVCCIYVLRYLAAVIHAWWSVCAWRCVCVASVYYYMGYGVCIPGEDAPSSSRPPIQASLGSLASQE